MSDRKHYHRGKRGQSKKSVKHTGAKKGGIVSTIVLIVAVAVFCVSAFQLYKIMSGYQKGKKEYDKVRDLAVNTEKGEDGQEIFKVDFDELLSINPDTVGWIRFNPEPSQINYPVVQGTDNSLYLDKTFSANDNTVGAIFVNVDNRPDFNDQNTIVYGHRMNGNSMFHDLSKYAEKEFWEANPYFYIYTPDGREIKYHIYSAGVVKDTSDTYLTQFATPEDFQAFLNMTKEVGEYDTGVEVTSSNAIVTLSTCTKDSNDDRFVVRGVKESENYVKGE